MIATCASAPWTRWLAWTLSDGALHVTDHTNAAVTGLLAVDGSAWSERVLAVLGLPADVLPALVDSSGVVGEATALPGSPRIACLVGDQQASLVGQGCVEPGRAKITFGTGGMLDVCRGAEPPASAKRCANGTYPIVAWSRGGELTWGAEAIMLSAGTNVEWLRDDLGVIATSAESHEVAASVDTSDGVLYVPALLGLGTPHWDYGARGTLVGLTRGSTRAHVVRAVLEGVAQRGADLVEAAEADTGLSIEALRVDGGMSANPTFTQALADATGAGSRCRRSSRRRRSGRPSSPASPPACGTTSPTPTARGRPHACTSRERRSTGRCGRGRSIDRGRGTPSCLHSTCERNVEFPRCSVPLDAVRWQPGSPARCSASLGVAVRSPDHTADRRDDGLVGAVGFGCADHDGGTAPAHLVRSRAAAVRHVDGDDRA